MKRNHPICNQRGFSQIILVALALLVLLGGGTYYFTTQRTLINQDSNLKQNANDVALTTDTALKSTITSSSESTVPKQWSSFQSWSTNEYTKTLFEFLKTKLSEEYIYTHFELINPEKAGTLLEGLYKAVTFKLHYGNDIAVTEHTSSNKTVDDPLFVSGTASVPDGAVRSYRGPLKEYEIKVNRDQAINILSKNGINISRDKLKLLIYDKYEMNVVPATPTTEYRKINGSDMKVSVYTPSNTYSGDSSTTTNQVFWITVSDPYWGNKDGVAYEKGGYQFVISTLVNALDESVKKEIKQLPSAP